MNYKEYNIMKNINCVQFIFTHTIENLKFYKIIKVILLILIYFYLDFDELFEYLNLKTTYFFQFIIQNFLNNSFFLFYFFKFNLQCRKLFFIYF